MGWHEPVSVAEKLARLILPHAPSGGTGRGFGAPTSEAAAFAMAGLSREQALMVRVAWLRDMTPFLELERVTWMHVVDDVVGPLGWHKRVRHRGHMYWRGMARLALCETIWPHNCPVCKGRRLIVDPIPRECPLCRGSGWRHYSRRKRAAIVGMTEWTWRTWQQPYLEQVRPIPTRWLDQAADHVGPRLRSRVMA